MNFYCWQSLLSIWLSLMCLAIGKATETRAHPMARLKRTIGRLDADNADRARRERSGQGRPETALIQPVLSKERFLRLV